MTLHAYTLFHLNLAFSSIEVEARPQVIERCYWPLLRLARDEGVPLAIEASAFTLERIGQIDPAWIALLRTLIAQDRVEFVGSGYVQLIGPLVPAAVNRANLRLGHQSYERLLGIHPTVALINEQAYAAGLLPIYAQAGYRAIVMDYDNCAHHHPEWSRALRYAPQRIEGSDGCVLDLIWTNTIAFQKVQRLAHGELQPTEYLDYVRAQRGSEPRAFALYGNDAEVFDYRPGRLATEAALSRDSEWDRITQGFHALREAGDVAFALPSQLLTRDWPHRASSPLRLETPQCPIPVKKQHKYNITRWAVTGRDDLDINSRCWRLYHAIADRPIEDPAWDTLCNLWASDFRTHITQRRWNAFNDRLTEAEGRLIPAPARRHTMPAPRANSSRAIRNGRFLDIETPTVRARLKLTRGLALEAVSFGRIGAAPHGALCGTLPHGHYDDVKLAFDWYSGSVIYDRPAAAKVTDLVEVDAAIETLGDGALCVSALIDTPLGAIRKSLTFSADAPLITYDIGVDFIEWDRASLRLGNFTLVPEAFHPAAMKVHTHNGGDALESFDLSGAPVDHGAPVSLQVSASCALGMTQGWADIGDDDTRLRIEVDKSVAALVGLVTSRAVHDTHFCRFSLSALEFDETRKPSPNAVRPRNFRFSLGLAA